MGKPDSVWQKNIEINWAMEMTKNILVCGGLPKAATTYLYTELSNYKNTYPSVIKESYLFERSDSFIERKTRALSDNYIYLDFTPEYIFNPMALKKIKDRNVNCFFILRDYNSWRRSLERYLAINRIKNDALIRITESQFQNSIDYAKKNFLTFSIDEIRDNSENVLIKIQSSFGLDFGVRYRNLVEKNSSDERIHYLGSLIHNKFSRSMKAIRSFLFGLI